jgi:hypothetical protein
MPLRAGFGWITMAILLGSVLLPLDADAWDPIRDIERTIRHDVARSVRLQSAVAEEVRSGIGSAELASVNESLRAQAEALAAIDEQVGQLAARAEAEESRKEAYGAGLFVSASANVLTGLGLILQFRRGKHDRDLKALELEKTRLELEALRRSVPPSAV